MGKQKFNYYSRTIVDGTIAEITVYGRYFMIFSNTGSNIEVSIGDDPFETFPKGIGLDINPDSEPFVRVRLKNSTGSNVSVEIMTALGAIYDNNTTIAGELNTDMSSDTLETPASITATNVAAAVSIAADTAQREIILDNQSAYIVWYGDPNVDSATPRGTRLYPNEQIVLSTSDKIYFHSPSGNAVIGINRLKK